MDNVKISATFSLLGRLSYGNKLNGEPIHYNLETLEVSDDKGHRSVLKTKIAKCKPASQSINMTQEAYNYMISTPVEKMSIAHWKRISNKQKIAEHLKEVQQALHATSFEFTIFED